MAWVLLCRLHIMRAFHQVRRLTVTGAGAALALLIAIVSPACTPEPRNVPCSNDGQCRGVSDELRYCLESRCVECVSSSSCGSSNSCVDGMCVIHCKDERDCRTGEACQEGFCKRR